MKLFSRQTRTDPHGHHDGTAPPDCSSAAEDTVHHRRPGAAGSPFTGLIGREKRIFTASPSVFMRRSLSILSSVVTSNSVLSFSPFPAPHPVTVQWTQSASAGTGNNTAAPAPPRCHWKAVVPRQSCRPGHGTPNRQFQRSSSVVPPSAHPPVKTSWGCILPRCSEWPFSPHFRLYTRCPSCSSVFRIFFRNTAGDLNHPGRPAAISEKDVEFS